jgi:hypothetical protein
LPTNSALAAVYQCVSVQSVSEKPQTSSSKPWTTLDWGGDEIGLQSRVMAGSRNTHGYTREN